MKGVPMPKKYVHFTDEQKEQARQTDLCELLRLQGETLKRSGSEYEWKDGSQKVTIRGNLWFHQYPLFHFGRKEAALDCRVYSHPLPFPAKENNPPPWKSGYTCSDLLSGALA